MADDMDDIEDLLEAPYKAEKTSLLTKIDKKTEDETLNDSNTHTNGNSDANQECMDSQSPPDDDKEKLSKSDENTSNKENTKSKESSKKSRKDRSRSRSGDRKHKKRSRSRSHSKKAKRSKSKERERSDKERSTKEHRRRKSSRSVERERDRNRRRKSHSRSSRSRTRSRSRHRRHRSKSRDNSRNRKYRRSRTPPKRVRSPELTPEERDIRTVFCMQLSNRIRPRDLEDFFSPVGKVRDVRLITDPRTKRSKGIAYIEFRDVDSVEKAIGLTGQRILGVPIICKLTQAEKNRMPLLIPSQGTAIIPQNGPMKLYIGSLHVNINEEMLRGIFEPFGSIDAIVLCKDDFGRSKGYGFIQFSHAEDAKKAMEQLNNFELANRPIKVAPFIEKPPENGSAIANLDNDDLDRSGVNLGPSGKLALMAKLAEGSGIKIPQYTLDAITASVNAAAAAAANINNQEYMQESNAATMANQPTHCFLLTNMFDLDEERTKPNWVEDIRDDVIEECTKYGGIVHIHIDQASPQGNIYIKCPSISIAMAAMAGLNGRYFAGKLIQASFLSISSYNYQFPESINCNQILKPSS